MLDRAVLAQALKRARQSAGLTQQQAADLLGVRRPAISEMEAGKRAVESSELFRLAEIYGVSFQYLVRGEEAPEDRIAAALFRAGERVAGVARRREVIRLGRVCRTVTQLERELGQTRSHRRLPGYTHPGVLLNKGTAYAHGGATAIEERERLRLGLAPIRDVWGVLESAGFHIVPLLLGGDTALDGLLVRNHDGDVCAGVNVDRWVFRQIFSAVHEYAHAVLDGDVTAEACSMEPRRWHHLSQEHRFRETRANQFAAVFLAPREALVQYFRATGAMRGDRIIWLTPVDIVRAMDHFGLSAEGLLWRLLNADLINARQRHEALGFSVMGVAEALGIRFEGRAWSVGQTQVLALEGYRRGLITLGRLAEVFGYRKERMYDLLRAWGIHQDVLEPAGRAGSTPAAGDR